MGRDPSEEDVYNMISEVGCTNKDYQISKVICKQVLSFFLAKKEF